MASFHNPYTSSVVRQGCILALALFRIAIDWIMSICADKAGVNVRQSPFTDVDYADDAVLFAENDAQWTSIFELFDAAANTIDFHTFWAKTKIQNVASGSLLPFCVISGHQVKAIYFGSDVDSSGYCIQEILTRIGLALQRNRDGVWGWVHFNVYFLHWKRVREISYSMDRS